MMCGGTSDVKIANEEIQGFCDQVRGTLEAKANKEFSEYKALQYKSQVVAGTNYFVKIKVGEQEHIHVRILKPLPHTGEPPKLVDVQDKKTADEDIGYF